MIDSLLIVLGWTIWIAFVAAIIHHKRSLKKFYSGNVPFEATILGRFLSIKSKHNITNEIKIKTPDFHFDPEYRSMPCNIYYRK